MVIKAGTLDLVRYLDNRNSKKNIRIFILLRHAAHLLLLDEQAALLLLELVDLALLRVAADVAELLLRVRLEVLVLAVLAAGPATHGAQSVAAGVQTQS